MKNILEYNSYDLISSLEDEILNLFQYVKVITNKIYTSTLLRKSTRLHYHLVLISKEITDISGPQITAQ